MTNKEMDDYCAEHIMKFTDGGLNWGYIRPDGTHGSYGHHMNSSAPGWRPTQILYQAMMVIEAFPRYSINKTDYTTDGLPCWSVQVMDNRAQLESDSSLFSLRIVLASIEAHKAGPANGFDIIAALDAERARTTKLVIFIEESMEQDHEVPDFVKRFLKTV